MRAFSPGQKMTMLGEQGAGDRIGSMSSPIPYNGTVK